MSTNATVDASRVRFRNVLAVRDFRVLWIAQWQSQIGEQLSRVALAVLVFGRTGSAAFTALVYALTFLPAVFGGFALGGLADRFSRRQVLIICDVLRAALMGVMALPVVPLPALYVLIALVTLIGAPFLAAQSALVPAFVTGEAFVVASGLRMLTGQASQLLGFAAGGLIVAGLGARGSLAVDAATFAVSAGLIAVGVRDPGRPSPGTDRVAGVGLRGALRLIAHDRRLVLLVMLACLVAFFVVPEGLAAPYAADLGGGSRMVGLLMAAPPFGTAVGAYLILRVPPAVRERLLGLLAFAAAIPLVLCVLHPGVGVSLLLWFLLGLGCGYIVPTSALLVQLVPDERRGQILGIVGSTVTAVQGLTIVGSGALAQVISPAATVATSGAVAAVVAAPIALAWARAITRAEGRSG